MIDIEKMSDGEWIDYRQQKLDAFLASGKELKINPDCNQCDPNNDYVCFYCEVFQVGE